MVVGSTEIRGEHHRPVEAAAESRPAPGLSKWAREEWLTSKRTDTITRT